MYREKCLYCVARESVIVVSAATPFRSSCRVVALVFSSISLSISYL